MASTLEAPVTRRRAGDSMQNRLAWAFGDQVLSSGTNFAVTVLVARAGSPAQFGRYALALMALLSGMTLVRTVVSQPFTIRFGASEESEFREAAREVAGAVLIAGFATALALFGAAFLVAGDRLPIMLMAVAAPAVLLQDAWRQILVASRRCRSAFLNDGVWALVQGSLLALTLAAQLGPSMVVGAWAAGAWAAALWGFAQTRMQLQLRGAWSCVRSLADLSRGLLLETAGVLATDQVPVYLVGALGGLTEVASYRGAATVLSGYTLLLQGSPFAMLPELVRLRRSAPNRLKLAVHLYACGLFAAAVLVTTAALIVPYRVGHALMGSTWAFARPLVLPVGLVLALLGVIQAASVGLRSIERTTTGGRVRLAMAPISLVAVTIGANRSGARGAAFGLILSLLATAAVAFRACWRALRCDQEK